MTGLEEKFWDAAITEAATTRRPPDQAHDILLRLQVPELEQLPPLQPPPRRVFRLRRGFEFAVAASLLLAIGVATGLIPIGREETAIDPETMPRDVAVAPGAEYEHVDDHIELKQGWLLVSTGAPEVHCDGSTLSQVDGRVLVHASGVPTRGQAEAVAGWLGANRLELEMVLEMKNWAKGTVLSALVLSGSAMLDGQKVEAPKAEGGSTSDWHVVRSVMDIDNLPKGVRFVNADGLDAAHMDFLSEVESLEAISMRGANELRLDHLQSLKALKKLEWLDIRGAYWTDYMAAPEALTEIASLKRLGADLVPAGVEGANFPYGEITLPVLAALSQRGVEIELGDWNPPSQEELKYVLDTLPTLRGMVIREANVHEMKLCASHKNLRSVELPDYCAGQIGLAYLARKATLDDLSLSASSISLDEVYQLSRMSLRFLRLYAQLADSPEMCFERLAGMKTLRELELSGLGLGQDGLAAFAKFKGMQALDRLRLEDDDHGYALMLAHHVPTRRLELSYLYIPPLEEVPESVRKGDASENLQEIRFEPDGASFNPEYMSAVNAASLKTYPNLKRIEVKRGGFEDPTMEDQFVNWLKENLPGVTIVVAP